MSSGSNVCDPAPRESSQSAIDTLVGQSYQWRMRNQKERVVRVRINTAQLDAWTAAAQHSGLTLSQWIRIRCNGTEVVAPTLKKAG